jgi:hypothetical protein
VKGVDVVEGKVAAPMTITFHSISVTGSNNVQIGQGNTQTNNIGKLISAVDHSTATEAEKEAKGLLEKMANNRVVVAALGAVMGAVVRNDQRPCVVEPRSRL